MSQEGAAGAGGERPVVGQEPGSDPILGGVNLARGILMCPLPSDLESGANLVISSGNGETGLGFSQPL
jgi:hypothetical protein